MLTELPISKTLRPFITFLLVLSYAVGTGQDFSDFDTLSALSKKHGKILMGISNPFVAKRSDFYLKNDWQYCLALTQKEQVVPCECRLNLARTQVEVSASKQIRQLRSSAVKGLLIAGKEFIYQPASAMADRSGAAFLEVLSRGDITLLKKYQIGTERSSAFGIDPGVGSDEALVLEWSLYYTLNGQAFKPLGRTKRNVLAAFTPHESSMELFMKDNHLKWRDPSHLSQAFDYFNTTFASD